MPTETETVLRARGVKKNYEALQAVAGVDFDVYRGECFGFLGPNGAGKSTCMKMLYRSALVDAGELEIFGLPTNTCEHDRVIKRRLGVVPQEENLDQDLTTRENLMVFGRFYGLHGRRLRERVAQLIELVELEGKRDAKVNQLSGGMKRRLLIARGLLGEPELMILDEPTTGLDPKARETLWTVLEDLRRRSMTLILTTHYMDEAEKLCDRLVFMDQGRIVAEGEPQALIREHARGHVVEFKGLAEDEIVRIEAELAGLDVASRRYAGRYLVQTDDEREVVARAHAVVPDRAAMLRRSNLEDVFLELTGRTLGADA